MGLLVVTFLLLVVMPTLLYLVGRGVKTYTERKPEWIGFPGDPGRVDKKSAPFEALGRDKY